MKISMKRLNSLLLLAVVLFSVTFTSCRKNDDDDDAVVVLEPQQIPNEITSNTTLTADRVWILKGHTYVRTGAVLTVEAGTVVKSDPSEKGALIITKGARLEANGTADKPIVFTSGRAANERVPGDWAGIVIIGRAPTNRTSEGDVEGGVPLKFGLDNVSNDNSGTLRYVRIEYAGNAVSQNSEVNALSLYAVGSGTTLDNIQISYAKDDAYEFFGGTVNGKHLISYGTSDDDFDFDNGYSGKIQFAVVLRRPELQDSGDDGNGIESNNESSIPTGGPSQPYTRPVISNFTMLGSNGAANEQARQKYGTRWRVASRFVFVNSIIAGFKQGGFVMESEQTATAYNTGASIFKNNIVTAITASYLTDALAGGVISTAALQTKAESEGSVTLTNSAAVGLTDAFNLSAPNFRPTATSPALQGTWVAPEANSTFFTQVNYRGAFAANDTWANGWTNFTPGTTAY